MSRAHPWREAGTSHGLVRPVSQNARFHDLFEQEKASIDLCYQRCRAERRVSTGAKWVSRVGEPMGY